MKKNKEKMGDDPKDDAIDSVDYVVAKGCKFVSGSRIVTEGKPISPKHFNGNKKIFDGFIESGQIVKK